jgi:hypothetical protein
MEALRESAKEICRKRGGSAPVRSSSSNSGAAHPILTLQQQAGNQAVRALMRSGLIQTKLTIGNPGDPEEQEADQVADQVMRAHAGDPVTAPCSCAEGSEHCDACRQTSPAIQRRADGHGTRSDGLESAASASGLLHQESGQPLDAVTRAFFEPRFGRDFSNVRVHTNKAAGESARSINAHAYTFGSNVVFAPGKYNPHSIDGRSLLAHELSHTIQQGPAAFAGPEASRTIARSAPAQEAEARLAAKSVLRGSMPQLTPGASPVIACESGNAPGGLHDDEQLGDAISAFNKHNSSLGADVLAKIRSGILNATDKTKTYEVAFDFFDHFSGPMNSVRQMTTQEETTAKERDLLAKTDTTLGFTTITLRSDVLGFNAVRLGNLLLHEFAHAFHTGEAYGGEYQEGQAYGTEYFFAESTGDVERMNKIKQIMSDASSGKGVCGSQVQRCKEDFHVVYALLTALAEVVKKGSSPRLPFPELNPTTAQKVEVSVMHSFQDPDSDLQKYKDYVKAHLSSFPNPEEFKGEEDN